ncbi:MAG: FHA domain-containing protein [Candidatus Poseidoniales archaeon]|nr:FHA domain-containing protein [Candidatus Poseidoniales archaeon]
MQCLDCGKDLVQADLLAVSCQGCGEPLMPEDVSNLEAKLGIVKEAPEIEAPVLVPEGGIKIPDVLDCKNADCGMPLYGSEIEGYMKGTPCQYCGKSDPLATSTPPTETPPEPEKQEEPQEPIDNSNAETSLPDSEPFAGNTLRSRFCTGPLAGTEFDLPTGIIIGRQFFNDIVATESKNSGTDSSWYSKCISRISREHLKLDEEGNITDMGSANGTILDREEIFGEGNKFGLGTVLNLADELMLTRVQSSDDGAAIRITNEETNITIDVPPGVQFHLGRLREDGRREPFAFAISDHMKRTDGMDVDEIRRISRRHVTVELQENGEIKVQNIDGKEVHVSPMKTQVEDVSTKTKLDANNTESIWSDAIKLVIGKSQYSISPTD